jgi:hypothetical protein
MAWRITPSGARSRELLANPPYMQEMRLAAGPVREHPEVAVLNVSRMKHSGNTIVVFCIERAGRSQRLSCITQAYCVHGFAI